MKNKKLNTTLIILILIMFFLLFFGKDKLSCFVTNYQLKHSNITINQNDSILFFKQFNNLSGKKSFELSLIELGGTGCKPCIRMDTILKEIKNIYKDKINLKIYRVNKKENRIIAKYFGVNAIPTQIILDKNSVEIYRHTGFLHKNKLDSIIIRTILNN